MAFLQADLRKIHFRGEDFVGFLAADSGLQSLFIEDARGFRVTAVIGRVSLEPESLRYQAIILLRARQAKGVVEGRLGLFAAASQHERLSVAPLDLGHRGRFVFQILEGFERVAAWS